MSAARKPTAAQARERRARIAAVVLGAVLVLVCAIQVPKLLKHGHGHGAPAPAAAVAAPSGQRVARVSVSARSTHLVRLARFAWKDPFRQQLQPAASRPAASPAAKAPSKPATPKPPSVEQTVVPGSAPPAQTKTFTSLPAKPVAAGRPGVLLLLNGRRLGLLGGDLFPTATPVFRLVSFTKHGARVALVAGTLSDGGETLRLRIGHKLVLRNASTGERYVLELVRLARVVPRTGVDTPRG